MMRSLKFILELLFWMVAAGTLLFGGAVLIGIGFAPVFGILGIAGMLMLFPVMMRIASNSRGRRGAMVLSYLEQATRLNLPLPRMLYAAQRSEPGKAAIRLANLRQRLEDGIAVGAALDMAVPEVSDRAVGIISAGERVGRLPQALGRLRREQDLAARRDPMDAVFFRIYPPLMVLLTAGILSMIAVFVLPKFEQIAKDFGMRMPPITVQTFRIAYMLGPVIGMCVVAAVLWTAARSMWETFHPARAGETTAHVARDHVLWWIPVVHSMQRDRGLADVFDLLADGVEAGMPPGKAIAQAGVLRINAVLRGKMLRWADGVNGGATLQDAAREAGLPAIVAGMLATARQRDDAANVMRFLARYYRNRFSRLAAVVHEATVPLVVLTFGVVVGAVTMSLFVPMTQMINHVASQCRLGP